MAHFLALLAPTVMMWWLLSLPSISLDEKRSNAAQKTPHWIPRVENNKNEDDEFNYEKVKQLLGNAMEAMLTKSMTT